MLLRANIPRAEELQKLHKQRQGDWLSSLNVQFCAKSLKLWILMLLGTVFGYISAGTGTDASISEIPRVEYRASQVNFDHYWAV
jgi:hypothetical protein